MRHPIYQKTAAALELPPDLAEQAPLAELLGRHHLRVANHRGILEYTAEHMVLACCGCRLEICGKELAVETYTRDELCLGGDIETVRFVIS